MAIEKKEGTDTFKMGNPEALPAIRYQTVENGPMVTLGHVLKEPERGIFSYSSDELKDGKVMTWAFDEETLNNSEIARRMEGKIAGVGSVGDYGMLGINSLVENIQELRRNGHKFNDYDRAVMKALENDLLQRAHPGRIEIVEAISRDMGNPPSPGFTRLDNEESYLRHLTDFLYRLPQEKKEFYVSPAHPPAPLPKGNELWGYGYSEQQLADLRDWRDSIYKFEHSLSPEESAEWEKIKEEGRDAGLTFHTGAPDISPLIKPAFEPLKIDPSFYTDPVGPVVPEKINPETTETPLAPKPETQPNFEVSVHKGPGPVPFDPNVLKAQELMAKMKELAGDNLPGVNLGHFKNHSGTGAEGLDGRFGKMTHESVTAAEKFLGIDPPTGKITDELVAKMQTKIDELSPPTPGLSEKLEIKELPLKLFDEPRVICAAPDPMVQIGDILRRPSYRIGTPLLETMGVKTDGLDITRYNQKTGDPLPEEKPKIGLDDPMSTVAANPSKIPTMNV